MKIKKSVLLTVMVIVSSMLFALSQNVQANTNVKSTQVPFEDKTFTTKEENKPHDISTKDKANKEIASFKEESNFNINVDGVETIKGKTVKFVGIAAGLIMGLAVIMITFAGFKITTSEGEPGKLRTAKMQIIGAGIGIGLSLFTLVIVKVYMEVLNVYNK